MDALVVAQGLFSFEEALGTKEGDSGSVPVRRLNPFREILIFAFDSVLVVVV